MLVLEVVNKFEVHGFNAAQRLRLKTSQDHVKVNWSCDKDIE